MFADRLDAARRLLPSLSQYRGRGAIVLGVPRGGVPMAAWLADELDAELDVLLVHKLPAPGNPEFAVGAVDESGRWRASDEAELAGATERYLEKESQRELKLLRERRRQYGRGRPPVPLEGRTVIVVDDGVATGATLLAGLQAARRQRPAKLIAAVGVAPTSTLSRLRQEADEVVCAFDTDRFMAVGAFFQDFSPVTDDEVIRLLDERRAPE